MAREVYRGELETLVRKGALLVDVREAEDLGDDEALPGHTHIPLSRITELADRISLQDGVVGQPIVFYCRSGLMSYQAAEIATAWTQQPVYYLSGGLLGSATG